QVYWNMYSFPTRRSSDLVLGIQSLDAHIVSGSCKLKSREVLNMSEEEWSKYRSRSISTIFQEPGSALNPLQKVGKQIEEILKIQDRKSTRLNSSHVSISY